MAGVAHSAGRRQSKTRNVKDTQAGASASRSASDCKERRSASQLPAKMNTTSLLSEQNYDHCSSTVLLFSTVYFCCLL